MNTIESEKIPPISHNDNMSLSGHTVGNTLMSGLHNENNNLNGGFGTRSDNISLRNENMTFGSGRDKNGKVDNPIFTANINGSVLQPTVNGTSQYTATVKS